MNESQENNHQKDVPTWMAIRDRMMRDGKRFWACDNIADYVTPSDKEKLIDELEEKFADVLDVLLIDRSEDPNSRDTPRRLAKMYLNEIMSGRYDQKPKATAFPNDDPVQRYSGMIVVRAELKSLCSHHHQPVKGVAYIGLLPSVHVIGLSKYARLAQWVAKRGTLQEELTKQIADVIQQETHTEDLAVYVQAEHGCMVNRGVEACSSLTQTAVLRGQFYNPSVKAEFLEYIRMQQVHSPKTVY